jgi:hypothetical protein
VRRSLACAALAVLLLTAPRPGSAAEWEVLPPYLLSPLPHEALLFAPLIDFTAIYSTADPTVYAQLGAGGKLTALLVTLDGGIVLSTGGFALVYSLFDLFSDSFNFIHSDFRIGGFADARLGRFLLEAFVSHTSSHLGDDLIWLTSPPRINIGCEAIRAYASYSPVDAVWVSLGVDYKFGRRPLNLMIYDTAFLAAVRLEPLELGIPLFLDCEVELPGWFLTPSVGARAGMYLDSFRRADRGPHSPTPHHEAYVGYYNGYSRRGYFSNRREQLLTTGFAYRM